jgi:hypothetical protein
MDVAKVGSIQSAYAGLTDIHIMPEEIWEEARMAQSANAQLIPYAQHVGNQFSDKAKGMIVAAAGSILAPSGKITPLDEQLLTQLATSLGLARPNTEAVLSQMR